jgi:uncharacterized Zn finger protein (UPF0148 family)
VACEGCGHPLSADATFCAHCGRPVETSDEAEAESEVEPDPEPEAEAEPEPEAEDDETARAIDETILPSGDPWER